MMDMGPGPQGIGLVGVLVGLVGLVATLATTGSPGLALGAFAAGNVLVWAVVMVLATVNGRRDKR